MTIKDVEVGYQSGREAGIKHVRALHWGLDPFGTLNSIWYCVKCIGMVNSHGGGSFSKSPRVVDGYTKVFHDVLIVQIDPELAIKIIRERGPHI